MGGVGGSQSRTYCLGDGWVVNQSGMSKRKGYVHVGNISVSSVVCGLSLYYKTEQFASGASKVARFVTAILHMHGDGTIQEPSRESQCWRENTLNSASQ